MTELPPSQESLETKVVTEPKKVEQPKQPLTLIDITGGLAKGLIPLAAGTAAGYWVTGGSGGAGCGLLLSSLGGMNFMLENEMDTRSTAYFCYKLGVVVGAVLSLGALVAYSQRQ